MRAFRLVTVAFLAWTLPYGSWSALADAALGAQLREAARLGDDGHIGSLLVQGANANAADEHGATPLHYAATSNVASVKLLLAHGARINSVDDLGDTPLHRCILYSWDKRVDAGGITAALIEAGAAVNAKDKLGATPLSYAKDPQLIALLRAHGATE